MPIGYLVSVAFMASLTVFALAPLRQPRTLALLSWSLSLVIKELPFLAFYWLLASTALAFSEGDTDSLGGWVVFGLAGLTSVGLGVIAWRGWRAGPAVARALSKNLGAGWRNELDPQLAARLRHHLPWLQILFFPILFRRHDVERLRNIPYGDAGRWNLLDLYRPRSHPPNGPTLVYLHGDGFSRGRKSREARPLLYRLASQGWVCTSANYRLMPAAIFPDHLIDLKKVIAWVREHGSEYGADPTVIFVAGSSAGGNLALLAALTPNAPTPRSLLPSPSTATTARTTTGSRKTACHPHRWRTTRLSLLRSSSRMEITTPMCPWEVPDSWHSGSAAGQPSQWCTPNYPADSTRSISSIPSASRRSSMGSRPSPLGSSRDPK
jgi:acetyl esterase/lipase